LGEASIWAKTLAAGIISMVAGFAISAAIIAYGLGGFAGAVLSIAGLGISIAGLYLSVKGFSGYMAARISKRKRGR